jgi:hypothetical protein
MNCKICFFTITASKKNYGGETASTGIRKFRLHTKRLPACKKGGKLNIIADDYNYALAA